MLNEWCEITNLEISAAKLGEKVKSDKSGAVVTFSGDVRDIDSGRFVVSLTYEIHPSAKKVLDEIVTRALGSQKEVSIAVAHRFGLIPIGETAFAVAVASEHRREAFEMCSKIVDSVKSELPIWKHQKFSDGTSEWVNCA